MVDRAVYSLEKESIPYWNKFLQGYYDSSGVSSDAFDQAVQLDPQGEARLTAAMEAKGIRLLTSVRASITYMGFNMQDPVVGGDSERSACCAGRSVSPSISTSTSLYLPTGAGSWPSRPWPLGSSASGRRGRARPLCLPVAG